MDIQCSDVSIRPVSELSKHYLFQINKETMGRFFVAIFLLLFIAVSDFFVTSSPTDRTSYNDLNLSQNKNTNNHSLIFAQVIYRHGDRNIVMIYPKDPNKGIRNWPGGFGQLTNEGKMQLYKLGQFFRRRYDTLLGHKYSPDKVYVRSTDLDRTLMSAQASLAGLFPPSDNEMFHKKIPWQPIPVHTLPIDIDSALFGAKNCPKYNQAFEKYVKENEEVQRIYTEYADLFLHWSRVCGRRIATIKDCYNLYKTLSIEKLKNKVLPDWAKEAIEPNGPLEQIAIFHHKMAAATPELARLQSGFLIREMLERFTRKMNFSLKPDRTIWFYSAHETTMANLLNSLNMFELHVPPYASSLHFELYKSDENEYYIQLFYRKLNEENPLPMNFPGCGVRCSINQLYELYRDIIPTGDLETECRLS